jgi:DME family drug/metabolite transporter
VSAPSSPARLRGLALIALAAVSWGTTGSVTAVLVARAGAHPLVIGTARLAVGAVILLALARAVAGPIRLGPANAWRCVGMGLAMAAFQASYFSAVTLTGIAITALLAICSAPLMIATLAAATLGERLTPRLGAALALGVAGTVLLVVSDRAAGDLAPRSLLGLSLALGAGLAYAIYVVIGKAALRRAAPLPLAAANFSLAAALLLPALTLPGAPQQLALGWPWLLYLGVVTTAGAYACYTLGLREVSASAAGIASLLEPLTATALGVLVFGERLGAIGTLGAALMLGALLTLAAGERHA